MATSNAASVRPTSRSWLRPSPTLAPSRWPVNLAAALLITTLIVALAVLVEAGLLPWVRGGGPPIPLREELFIEPPAIVVWFVFVQFAALLLPLLLFVLVGWRDRRARALLLPYLLILASHICSEAIFRQLFFTNISLFLGLLYSPYRSWQSWYLAQEFAVTPPINRTQRFIERLLLALAVIWALNLLVLIALKLPRVVGSV